MTQRMLIDGTHPEEVRVVVTESNKLLEYDVESSTKTQNKGNIYLAKVMRVEPSLQAAFVDYGGNRHGFLAFSEIHPDYYQIPIEDREALEQHLAEMEEEAAAAKAHIDEIDGDQDVDDDIDDQPDADADDDGDEERGEPEEAADDDASAEKADTETDSGVEAADEEAGGGEPEEESESDSDASEDESENSEQVAGAEAPKRGKSRPKMRRYKIQEVIKRNQILLVQVVKEERGNKGAALTTYMSLAGRYCVLMPNVTRGSGGVSRKITNASDRRRLRDLLKALDVPKGMGVIMRTAGMERNKSEIKRDFDYLTRVWEEVREKTMESSAPALVYEEGDLIKRAIRDLYSRDVEEVWVEGNETYQAAKKMMRLMMPSHAKRVQPYKDDTMPMFHRYQVENQIEAMHNPTVQLKSGGYLVINPTEALVAIDVNSGRATKQRNIEETATKTNLEAATEIGHQLKLRDLAGLIVIDFIDMEDRSNQRAVEKRFKEAVKNDRARIQVGRISNFGLLELSRQRMRPSLIENSTEICPHCEGTGSIRSTESMTLHALRMIEEEGTRLRSSEVSITLSTKTALYLLNEKRHSLQKMEERYGFTVKVIGDDEMTATEYRLDRVKAKPGSRQATEDEKSDEAAKADTVETDNEEQPAEKPRRKRSRRRRRKADDGNSDNQSQNETASENSEESSDAEAAPDDNAETAGGKKSSRRRRGRRGGRRRGQRGGRGNQENASAEGEAAGTNENSSESSGNGNADNTPAESSSAPSESNADAGSTSEPAPAEQPSEPAAATSHSGSAASDQAVEGNQQPRRGWWQRILD